ncbi:hypothetical protein PENSPDRAFT_628005 [Peniophora sp. CONT]|nr:hypothetical protein PENSPDRAFT_628005 [Peniophora sp. CONT]
MSFFQPARSSTPPRRPTAHTPSSRTLAPSTRSLALSDRTSTTNANGKSFASGSSLPSVSAELSSLTREDIAFLDAVVRRCQRGASGWMALTAAYGAELEARGIDGADEVVYYAKLLKIGSVKGTSWSDKWASVKRQYGYDAPPKSTPALAATQQPGAARLLQRLRALQHSVDESTSESVPRPFSPTEATEITDTDSLDAAPPHFTPAPASRFRTEPSPAPSYHTNAREATPIAKAKYDPYSRRGSLLPPSSPPKPTRAIPPSRTQPQPLLPRTQPQPQPISQPQFSRKLLQDDDSDDEDAWARIKRQEDEDIAREFFEDRLVERCWDVWKQGYQWTVTTSNQIAAARTSLTVRRAFTQWHARTLALRERDQAVAHAADTRLLARAFTAWQATAARKKQERWRTEMRGKMRAVRAGADKRMLKEAWAIWRERAEGAQAERIYAHSLLARAFGRWRAKLGALDQLDARADTFAGQTGKGALIRAWDTWRKQRELRVKEDAVRALVGRRVKREVMVSWKARMESLEGGDVHADALALRHAMQRWKARVDKLKVLDRKATKHAARTDDVLRIAIIRIWRARARGRLLERLRDTALQKRALTVWSGKVRQNRELEEKALAFASRVSSPAARTALMHWTTRLSVIRQSSVLAQQYHAAQTQYKALYTWRIALRVHLKRARQARHAERFFVLKRAMGVWQGQMKDRERERKLQDWDRTKVRKAWELWRTKSAKAAQLRQAESQVVRRVMEREAREALSVWTSRVIAVKERELDVAMRADAKMLAKAMGKWKAVCGRHVEVLNLMESYRAVKQEERLRAAFYAWRSRARRAHVLRDAEDEFRRRVLTSAFERWRGALAATRLAPLERMFAAQNRHALMYKAFEVWRSRTTSLPAVRFHAAQLKGRAWSKWRAAMPRALQAKEAREHERKAVLARAYGKWLKALRTKMALRAVARARNMGLGLANATASSSSAPSPFARVHAAANRVKPVGRPSFGRALPPPRPQVLESETEAETEAEPEKPLKAPLPRRSGIASLLAARPATTTPTGRAVFPAARAASPTRTRRSASPVLAHTRRERDRDRDRERDASPSPPLPSRRSVSPVRTRWPGTRDRGRSSREEARDGDRDESPVRSVASQPVGGRTSLWSEMQGIQRARPGVGGRAWGGF